MADSVIFLNTRNTAAEADPCFAAARTLGLDVVLLTDREPLAAPGMLAECVKVDTFDIPACVAAAKQLAVKRNVKGVVTWGDRDVEPVAAIAQALSLPGTGVDAASAARNKYLARSRLLSVNPGLVPRFRRVLNMADLDQAVNLIGTPAVLKPTGASASKGVLTVSNPEQARAAFGELQKYTRPESDPIFRYQPGELIYEEMLSGSEHSVEGIVHEGELMAAFVTDKWVKEPYFIEYQQVSGSTLTKAVRDRLIEAAQDVVSALGLKTGAIHLEFRVDPIGTLKVIELNARTGGNYITSHLVPWATQYRFLENVISVAIGDAPEPVLDPPPILWAGSRQVLVDKAGQLAGIDGVDRALSIPGVRGFTYEAPIGSTIAPPPISYTSMVVASVLAIAGSPTQLTDLLSDAEDQLVPNITGGGNVPPAIVRAHREPS